MTNGIRKLSAKRIDSVRRRKGFPFFETAIGLIAAIVLAALFFDTKNIPPNGALRVSQNTGGNALEFNVRAVNQIIAQDFNLSHDRGVLVDSSPTGVARRLFDIRRGDIVLQYNNINVESVNHFAYLLSTSNPGDTISFLVWRSGRKVTVSGKIPPEAGVHFLGPKTRDILVVCAVIILTFTVLFMNIVHRTVCVTLGAVLMLVAGSVFGFYAQADAFDSIRLSPIFILAGMSVFAIFLEDLRFFEYVSKKIILLLKADGIKIILAFCALTCFVSAFLDNISTVLVLMPISIYAAKSLNYDPIPIVIAEVIAATVGGGATAIGNFPNILISSSTGLTFNAFLLYMLPISVLFTVVFLWYMWFSEFRHHRQAEGEEAMRKAFLEKTKEEVSAMRMDWPRIKRVLVILGSVIIAFMILPGFRVQQAPIALGGGFLLLAIEKDKAKEVIKKISLIDLLFFIALFLIVGGALYSGLLGVISNFLVSVSMGNKILFSVFLLWTVAVFTAVLNAGPAAAFFIPIVMQSGYANTTDVVWWAVSLGTVAGACAFMSGASAGIIAPGMVEKFCPPAVAGKKTEQLTFASYSKRGIPIALIFLAIATVYLTLLCMLP